MCASFLNNVIATTLDQGISALTEAYKTRFTDVFPYPKDFPTEDKDELEEFSREVTSNLFGGVGYFYGNSVVNKKFSYEWDEEEESAIENDGGETGAKLTEPKALLTATPSRSFFPRGFYWYVFSKTQLH